MNETLWASETQERENEEENDGNEGEQLRIVEWAKELQKATEVRSPAAKRHITNDCFGFFKLPRLAAEMIVFRFAELRCSEQ